MDGDLALSRAFGDYRLKCAKADSRSPTPALLPPEWQKVVPIPTVIELPAQQGDLVVLASDGLFDVLSNHAVALLASAGLSRAGETGGDEAIVRSIFDVSQRLVAEALRLGSSDNVTCVVMRLG